MESEKLVIARERCTSYEVLKKLEGFKILPNGKIQTNSTCGNLTKIWVRLDNGLFHVESVVDRVTLQNT